MACVFVCVGSGGRRVRVVLSMGLSRWRTANQLQISEVYKSNGRRRGGKYEGEVVKEGRREGRKRLGYPRLAVPSMSADSSFDYS